jgi:hypothetical protein
MRVAFLAALVGAALARPAPIAAQQTPSALPTEAGAGATEIKAPPALPSPQSGAFARLFEKPGKTEIQLNVPVRIQLYVVTETRSLQQPTIVCGMTLIPANPTLDAAIRHTVPEGGPKPVISVLEPRDCRR